MLSRNKVAAQTAKPKALPKRQPPTAGATRRLLAFTYMKTADPTMLVIRAIWQKRQSAGMTLEQLGKAMGYAEDKSARVAAYQFLQADDPRVSSVRRFAKAMGISPARLVK